MKNDLECLVKDIACSDRLPARPMRSAMAHARALVPRIVTLAGRSIAGDWLYPTEKRLLTCGFCVMAAARERAVWPTWLALLELSDARLEDLLGGNAVQTIAAVTLGLVDDDAGAVAALIEDRAAGATARKALIGALARLMREGRYPRAAFVDMIDRLRTLTDDPDDEFALWNVGQAIILGGIGERADLLELVMYADMGVSFKDIDREETRNDLAATAENPGDLARFDELGIAAPREPADAMRELARLDAGREPVEPHAAPLSWREREWIAARLEHARPPTTFEELDGFHHAIMLGPDCALPSENLSGPSDEEPVYESENKFVKELSLLRRNWNAIARRSAAGETPRPWIEPHEGRAPGELWCRGFLRGVKVNASAWDAAPEDSDAFIGLANIVLLADGDLDEELRANLLFDLPYGVGDIDRYWRALRERPADGAQDGMRKPGGDGPCPCGSGKTWKNCCGAEGTVH
jgi:uncharacterized protein